MIKSLQHLQSISLQAEEPVQVDQQFRERLFKKLSFIVIEQKLTDSVEAAALKEPEKECDLTIALSSPVTHMTSTTWL